MRSPDSHIDHLLINNQAVPVVISVNARAKRLILKVDPLAPEVRVTCPSRRHAKDCLAFAQERAIWIAQQLISAPPAVPFHPGARIPFRGAETVIVHNTTQRRAVHFCQENHTLHVGGDSAHLPRRVTDWLKGTARREFANRADRFCEQLGVTRKRLSIRDTRSRWGSCSSDGAISLSWRLILTPDFVSTYVVAHEVSHLRFLDHSAKFWETVDTLVNDRHAAEKWLKKHGTALYGVGRATTSSSAPAE